MNYEYLRHYGKEEGFSDPVNSTHINIWTVKLKKERG